MKRRGEMSAPITEIIPDDAPEWIHEGIRNGNLFRATIAKVEQLERERDGWKEDARQQTCNRDYWMGKYTDTLKKPQP